MYKIATLIGISPHYKLQQFPQIHVIFFKGDSSFYIMACLCILQLYDEKIPQLVTIITQTSVRRFVTNIIHFSY